MNKAVPWNISGVGFDAREAAREAARRQGKSLGEWLHSVIADHAADLGLDSRQVGDQDRIDAVTSKLERLSARTSDGPRIRAVKPVPRDESDEPVRRRRPRSYEDDPVEQPRRSRRSAPIIEETEYLLEEAVDLMERRATRSERRTDEAIASFAKVLESSVARRDSERDAVRELSEKLSQIEAKLGARTGHDETPIKGALARLEARLETIGRRTSAEVALRRVPVNPPRHADTEPLRRLEDKLNTILQVVAVQPAHPLKGTIPSERRAPDSNLGEAIAEIARRQQILDDPAAAADAILAEKRRARPVIEPRPAADEAWQQALAKMQAEIAGLATSIDNMRFDASRQRDPQPEQNAGLEGLRSDIGSMSKTLRELSPRGTVTRLQGSIDTLMRRVEQSRDQGVADRVLQPVEDVIGDLHDSMPAIDPSAAIGSLQRDVQEIAEKVGGLTDASAPMLARLQQQMGEIHDLISAMAARPLAIEQITQRVAALAAQVERAGIKPGAERDLGSAADDVRALIANVPGNAALTKIEDRLDALSRKLDAVAAPHDKDPEVAGLERLVRDLGNKIEAVQSPDASGQAFESLQQQVELLSARFEQSEGSLASLSGLERSMKDLFSHIDRVGQNNAAATTDTRTQSTLTAVHQMLEHVVGRLSTMESEMTSLRRPGVAQKPVSTPAPAPAAAKSASARDFALGDIHPSRDTMFTQSIGAPKPAAEPQKAAATTPLTLDDEHGRADYIAAARRAAKAAQSDPAIAALRQGTGTDKDARASLLARSRDYVATHKRPVLLSVAAVFVVLGTMAIVQRMTFDKGDAQMAALSSPAPISRVADASPPRNVADASRDDLSPSALPKTTRAIAAQIPGSDPVETASIQASLPSFAAQGASRSAAARPAIPSGLFAMAQGGDAGAEYELAVRYADGKDLPRDLKSAAIWFGKAADQGLAPAQYRLAALYEKGIGVAQDKARAHDLYLQAAEAGNPRAMHNLAVLMADGNGKPDYASAASWFAKAASYGVHDSQYNLAVLLARGLGVQQSLVTSYKWFAIAAQQNDADAAKKRDEVADKLNANDLAVAKALVAAFQPRNANVAAVDVTPPPGGWDSLGASSHINSAGSKISSL